MGLFGFLQNQEAAAYLTAGSFLGFLVHSYGMETFVEFQHSLDYEKAYGKSLGELDAEWRAFLETVPTRPETELYATQFFDTRVAPSYRSLSCPKVGATPLPLETEARRQRQRGEYAASAESYRTLYEREPSWRRARLVAAAMEDGENWEGALGFLAAVSKDLELEDFERAALMARRVRLLVKLRNWEGLYAAYDERAAGDYLLTAGNRLGEICLRDPQLRDRYALLFTEEEQMALAEIWRGMLEAWPDFPPLLCLYAKTGIPATASLQRREEALVKAASQSPEMADLLAPDMISLYNEAMAAREYRIATGLCQALVDHCANARYRYEGELGLERLAFERNGGATGPGL
jgi:hypothetical protein